MSCEIQPARRSQQCNTMRYHTIQCNYMYKTMQYHKTQLNSQLHAVPYDAMQYNGIICIFGPKMARKSDFYAFHCISWHRMVMHGYALYLMVLYSFACHCIVLYGIAWYCIISYGIAWYCIVGFGARAVSRKTPIYFIAYLILRQQYIHNIPNIETANSRDCKKFVLWTDAGIFT